MGKKIIFDVGHPAQVHQFKHLYWKLEKDGWEGLFSAKDKEVAIELLNKLDLPYKVVGKNEKGMVKKLTKLPVQIRSFDRIVRSFNPNLILSRFSIHAAFVARFRRIPNIGFADTEHTGMLDRITNPLINCKLTAYSYEKEFKKNHFRYKGNIELFYLHPQLFKPNPNILANLGVKKDEKYVIIRFVSWDAHHDVGHAGLTPEFKKKLVNKLANHAHVFITSENKLPPELEPFRIQIPIEQMHDALAFAHLYIGEGGTMASEAACLGTPSIYINELDMGYIREEVKYGLLKNFRNSDNVLSTAIEIIKDNKAKEKGILHSKNFISQQINVTEFTKWFIENYPNSINVIRENQRYQDIFK